MKTTSFISTVVALLGAYSVGVSAGLPDTINVHVKNLAPEDTIYDRTRQLFYQSNLWKGMIEVWDNKRQSHFNVKSTAFRLAVMVSSRCRVSRS